MQAILNAAISQKPRHWQLPILACQAVGGDTDLAVPGMAALACLHISIMLIDDMLDEDPRGEHHRLGKAVTANLAAAFMATGLAAIAQSPSTKEKKISSLRNLIEMFHLTAYGQHLDIKNPADEASYWLLVNTKSSPFFGSAMYLGAILGGTSHEIAAQIKQFGQLYGIMIQIHDDLNDVLAVPANSDWVLGRTPLPILYAQIVQHPDQERFMELRQTITEPGSLRVAQTILIRCGAISYSIDQLLKHYHAARSLLNSIPVIHKEVFDAALEDIIAPIKHLLVSIGIQEPHIGSDYD